MKRHTYKNKNILGILIITLMVVAGVGIGIHNTNAADYSGQGSEEVELKFTFEDSLKVEFPTGPGWDGGNHTTELGDVEPGTSKESDETGPITVGSNAGGYYVSATAGTKSGNADLNPISAGTGAANNKISILDTSANLANISEASGNAWGVRFAVDNVSLGTQTYNGLPVDDADNGETGTKIIDESQQGQKSFKYQVGVKTEGTLLPGTYQNVMHIYMVAK